MLAASSTSAEVVQASEAQAIRQCAILIVEDDFLSRTVLRTVLEKEGFGAIEEAENGEEALEKLAEFKPQLIISDIRMPKMDGFTLCQRIRTHADAEIASLPILIQTGLTEPEDKARIFAAGATDYLTKPIDPKEVAARAVVHLERLLILRRLRDFNMAISGEMLESGRVAQGEVWSSWHVSETMHRLLDEIEHSHHEMKAAKERAESADKLKMEFMGSVTHELKTPVHCILNFAQIGLGECEKGRLDMAAEFFTDILTNAKRLDSLVADVLDYSKVESGNMTVTLQPYPVLDLVRGAVKMTKLAADAKQVQVEIGDWTGGSEQVMVDPRRAEQVFINLMNNAIRFTPEGKVIRWQFRQAELPPIETGVGQAGRPAVAVTITDSGAGLPPEDLERIFQPFVQGKKVVQQGGGTGLGLAICRRIVGLFHGTIHADNAPEGGAVFEVVLPLHEEQTSE